MAGRLYGVGVGPGNPELLTLRAHRLISSAEIIAYPAPDTGESFARRIVADFIPPNCVEIPIVIPMLAKRFPAQEIYEKAAAHIHGHLQNGEDVVVLCEGDPLFYGSFMYLFTRLVQKAEIEIIPGVSALSAVSAAAQRPLCARNSCLNVIPATLSVRELRARLRNSEAVAFIKVGQHLEKIRTIINESGQGERAVFVSHASLGNQKICALEDAPANAPYFSMVIIPARGSYV